MRIAEIAPASLTVPPQGYGGIELVVALLADGAGRRRARRHAVASGGSRTRARLVCPLEEPPGTENMEPPIWVAKRAGMPLKMAVKIAEPAEREYWDEQVVPRMTGEEEVVRNASHDRKVALLRGAGAILFPIQWDEPFGLVMVESMACGTPILSFPRGAALEIVDDGVNGYLVDDVDAMVESVGQVAGVKPDTCRRSVEERFSARTMIEGYRDVFDRATRG